MWPANGTQTFFTPILLRSMTFGLDARIQRSNRRQVNRVYNAAADQEGVAKNQSMRSLIDLALSSSSACFCRQSPKADLCARPCSATSIECFSLFCMSTLAHGQVLAGIADATERHEAARIVRFGKAWIVDERQSLRRKQFRIDGIPCKPVRAERTLLM